MLEIAKRGQPGRGMMGSPVTILADHTRAVHALERLGVKVTVEAVA
jgi:hypothetical protein